MKLFSRKGIVAAAASAALVSGVFAAPAMAEETTTQNPEVQVLAAEDTSNGSIDLLTNLSSGDEAGTEEGDENNGEDGEGSSASELGDWISVFTAVIGALSALFGFIALF